MLGCGLEDLPRPDTVEAIASRLFRLIDADSNGYISKEELLACCLLYDHRVPVNGIEDTFESVQSFCGTSKEGLGYGEFFMHIYGYSQ